MTDNTISRTCQCPACGGRQRTRAVTRVKCVYCGRSYLVRHTETNLEPGTRQVGRGEE